MNPILSHERHIKQLENTYYHNFSSDRYTSVEYTRSKFLIPFEKEYIHKGRNCDESNIIYPQMINDIIENTLKIKRFDLLCYYQDHNNSPSVRSLHTARLLFIIQGKFYYYSIYDDRLISISKDHSSSELFDDEKIYIFGLSDVLNLARYYGEFSLYISILDAGHLLYNVKNTLVGKNMDFYLYKRIPSKYIYEHVNIDSRTTYISFAIEISCKNLRMTEGIYFKQGCDRRLSLAYNELKSTRFLNDILHHYNDETETEKKHIRPRDIPFLRIPSTLTRTSAHTTVGNNNYGEMFERFDPKVVLDYIKRSNQLLCNPYIDYCFLVKKDNEEFIYWSDFSITPKKIDYRSVMYNEYKFFDLDSYRFIFICYTKTKYLKENGLVNHLISSAEIMQLTALYADLTGYSFRPMKNHDDLYLKKILSLDEEMEINFMGVVCNSPIQQLSYYF